ncbi:MAG: AMP-binding protein [Thermoguttaceae bacterium]
MSGLSESIYMRSPIWLQQAAVAVWGAQWYWRRFGGHFSQFVAEYLERDRWSAERLRDYQAERLAALFDAAWRSPYYREAFSKAGMSERLGPWEAMAKAPLLSKNTLRSSGDRLLTTSRLPRGVSVFSTSGSTGTPTKLYYTREFLQQQLAILEARSYRYAGVTHRDRRFMCGVRKVCRLDQSKPPFWRFSPAENLAYASAYHLSPRFLPDYLAFLRRYQPRIIMGYPSALSTIASYALEHNDMPAPARCVITTSETVTLQIRDVIERAWQCRLFDQYGCSEGCCFASQCEHGRYHVSEDLGIIEILNAQGQPAAPGDIGEIVCTGLLNTLQPLIRYRIGDVACWAPEQTCPCGRSSRIIESIDGRLEDMCCTPDGRQTLRFDTVFKGIDHIREAQVIQEKPDLFVLRVVPAEGFGPSDADLLRHNMLLHVGNVQIEIETVEAIERAASGKFRAVVCRLTPEERKRLLRGAT